MSKNFKYSAFISYSHADKATVGWLHRTLERYRVPKNLVGLRTPKGKIPRKFKPIFRDRDDLSAATSLGKSIKKALAQSETLIVVCSPEAATSKWVAKEILEFKKLRGIENIFCIIARGQNQKYRSLFPEALWQGLSQEEAKGFDPIAADLREGRDGKRLAKLKLISGLLGLELDTLIQREAKRRQIQIGIMAATFSMTTIVLSVLLYIATEARKDAERNRLIAEERQFQAENLVEFMIGDLRENLAPIGSLQIMDKIAVQALGYYSSDDPEEMSNEALGRRTEVLLMLGEIQSLRGNSDQARSAFQEAYKTTAERLDRDPTNPVLIYDHSQSVFWLGAADLQQGDLEQAEIHLRQYSNYAKKLVDLAPNNQDFIMEKGFAHSNLGTLLYKQGRFQEAEKEFQDQLAVFLALENSDATTLDFDYDVAQSYAWLSDAQFGLGKFNKALENRLLEKEMYNRLLAQNPLDIITKGSSLVNNLRLGLIYSFKGEMARAHTFFEEGLRLGDDLLSFDPENTETKANLSRLILEFVEFHDFGPAEGSKEILLNRALELTSTLMDKDPNQFEWRLLRQKGLLLQAGLFLEKQFPKDALTVTLEVSNTLQQMWESENHNFQLLEFFGLSALTLWQAYMEEGTPEKSQPPLRTFNDLAETYPQGLTIRAQDYLTRVFLITGQKQKAQQMQDFLKEIGYNNPAFTSFLSKGANE